MSQALRKLTGTISKSGSCLVFINQIRMKIGVMFGNPETTTGGNALKFYSSVRLENPKNRNHRQKVRKTPLEIVFASRSSRIKWRLPSGVWNLKSCLVKVFPPVEACWTVPGHDMISKSGSWYSSARKESDRDVKMRSNTLEDHPEVAGEN
jgi:recombination protein RecA